MAVPDTAVEKTSAEFVDPEPGQLEENGEPAFPCFPPYFPFIGD